MIEQLKFDNYPFLKSITTKREQLHLNPIDIDLLKIQVGSQDPQISENAQRLLRKNWNLNPEVDSLHAESIDINEQLSPFSRNELKIMFNNIVAIQLTDGCNGECPFCMLGLKKGVTAKYSYDSLQKFFQSNSDILTEHSFVLYWNSDPFDYRDGTNSFVDVYQLYKKTLPNNVHYISTTIPRGGEQDFIKFMTYLASEQITKNGLKDRIVPVRLSITRQNIQRIEAVLQKLTKELINIGYSESDINSFYNIDLLTAKRFDNFILPIGPLIHKADDLRDNYSVACRDGVIISPKFVQASMMTAASIYNPSGQKSIDLTPGMVEKQVPYKVRDEQYVIWTFYEKSLVTKINHRQALLPIIKYPNGSEYSLPENIDDISLKLGREAAAFDRLLLNISRLSSLELNSLDPLSEKIAYLNVSVKIIEERQVYTRSLISFAEQLVTTTLLSEKDNKQIQYFILLTQTYMSKLDFLADQFKQGKSINLISTIARILAQVGRNQIESLPAIMKALYKLDDNKPLELDLLDKKAIRLFIENIR